MPRLSYFLTCLFLCSIFWGLCGRAAAAATPSPAGPEAEQVTKARQLFEEQKYDEAADALREAFRLAPNPLFLFNAGQSYRKGKSKAKALEMYRQFLQEAPEHKLAAEAKGYVTELESELALQERLSSIKLELEAEKLTTKEAQERAEQAQKALDKERKKPWYKRPWFYALAGSIGGALVLTAGVAAIVVVTDPRRNADAQNLQVNF